MNPEQIDILVTKLRDQADGLAVEHPLDVSNEFVAGLMCEAADAIYDLSIHLAVKDALRDYDEIRHINGAVAWVEMMLRSVQAVEHYDAKAAILGRIGAVMLEDFSIVLYKASGAKRPKRED